MKHTHNRTLATAFSSLILVASIGLAACGSDAPKQADTAEPGSTFCDRSQTARDLGAKVDITSGNSDELKEQIAEALTASKKAADAAPKDFEDLADESIDVQERFIEILEANDYDVVAASATDEGKKFFQDPRFTKVQDERDAYLADRCGIKASDDSAGSDISLAEGDEGIRQLFTLLQLNPETGVTDEQVDCAVDALSGNISDEDIAAIANQGDVSAAGTSVFNEVASTCGISLSGS